MPLTPLHYTHCVIHYSGTQENKLEGKPEKDKPKDKAEKDKPKKTKAPATNGKNCYAYFCTCTVIYSFTLGNVCVYATCTHRAKKDKPKAPAARKRKAQTEAKTG